MFNDVVKMVMCGVIALMSVITFGDDGTQSRLDFNKVVSDNSSVIKLIDSKCIKVNSGTGYGMVAMVITVARIDYCKYIIISRVDTQNGTAATMIHANDCEYCKTGKIPTHLNTNNKSKK